jgi:hypothetical protein
MIAATGLLSVLAGLALHPGTNAQQQAAALRPEVTPSAAPR